MNSAQFWIDLAERTVGTFAQAAGAALTMTAVDPAANAWLNAAQIGGVAALYCVIKSLVGTKIGDPSTAAWERLKPPTPAETTKVDPAHLSDQQVEIALAQRRRQLPS